MANPVPSDKIVDFKSNSETLDEVVNSSSETINTRTGKTISTHAGWQSQVDELIQQGQIDIAKAIRDAGYQKVGTFESGATLTDFNQALEWAVADGGDGNWYRWDGAYNKVVPASSTPAGTGGVGAGAWINVTDLTLRSELPKLTALGGRAVFKQASDLVSMTTKDGQLDAATLEAMRVAGTRYKVESFYGDGESGSFDHFLLNGADKSAQGYDGSEGYACFQIDLGAGPLDLWSCLVFGGTIKLEHIGARYSALDAIDNQIIFDLLPVASCVCYSFENSGKRFSHSSVVTLDGIKLHLNKNTLVATDTTASNPSQSIKLTGYKPKLSKGYLATKWNGSRQANTNAAAINIEQCQNGFKLKEIEVLGTLSNPWPNVLCLVSNCTGGTISDFFGENSQADGLHIDYSSGVKVTNAEVINTGDDGFAVVSYNNVSGYTRAEKHRLSGLRTTNSSANGIRVSGGKNIKISDFQIFSPAKAGLQVNADASYDTMSNEKIFISNGTIESGGTLTGGRTGAIQVLGRTDVGNDSCKKVRISNVDCFDSAGAIIRIATCNDVILKNINGNGAGSCTFGTELFDTCIGVKIVGGKQSTVTEHGVSAVGSSVLTDVVFDGIDLHNINTSNGGTNDGFNIPTSCTVTDVYFLRNKLSSTTTLNNFIEAQHYSVHVAGNIAPDKNVSVGASGNGVCKWLEQPSKSVSWGTAAPTTGQHYKGSTHYNTNPTVDGNNMVLSHWLCTVDGNPGTWVAQYYSTVSPAS